MNIGEKIKEMAEDKKVSAQELAKRVKRTRQTIYDIYNNRVSVSVEMLESIAKALEVPIANFFIEDPDTYYDNIPQVIPIREVLKLMDMVHEQTREGMGMINLRIFLSRNGMYLFESVYRNLREKITEEEIEKFGKELDESNKICS
jgi:transcriptional regulator with XRE-family HTH domain